MSASTINAGDGDAGAEGGRLAGHAIVDALRLHGVDMVFGVPGESYLAVIDGLHDANDIRTIMCRQEGGDARRVIVRRHLDQVDADHVALLG